MNLVRNSYWNEKCGNISLPPAAVEQYNMSLVNVWGKRFKLHN